MISGTRKPFGPALERALHFLSTLLLRNSRENYVMRHASRVLEALAGLNNPRNGSMKSQAGFLKEEIYKLNRELGFGEGEPFPKILSDGLRRISSAMAQNRVPWGAPGHVEYKYSAKILRDLYYLSLEPTREFGQHLKNDVDGMLREMR